MKESFEEESQKSLFESEFEQLGLEKYSEFTRCLPEKYIFVDESGDNYILPFSEYGRRVFKNSTKPEKLYCSESGLPVIPGKSNYYARYGQVVRISADTLKQVSTDVKQFSGSEVLAFMFIIPKGTKIPVTLE